MAALSASWIRYRHLPRLTSQFCRVLRNAGPQLSTTSMRRVHRSPRSWVVEKGAWGKARMPETHHQFTELDKADALMLRKSHETGFLSWFRNGLLATGIGVIAFVQSDVGREAAYAFFILGGVCVSFGGASYVGSLLTLRRFMLLSLPAALLQTAVVTSAALFWLCAVSLYVGRLEVEIIHDDDDEDDDMDDQRHRGRRRDEDQDDECPDCKARRGRRQDK
ncbi:transmembrane protein 160 isoform X2 [Clupea harengus]|uniref:Transmembrane protein 160 isoform X2 n=1 Tax=Clupea harengus TaxID=7950 RepID=A0A6P3VYT6_CLUHA|nr:transmembrane protein 160 isoform X2 [Clupea harengus]